MSKDLRSQELRKFLAVTLYADGLKEANSGFPMISVVIPSLNQGKFLERTILSVLNQNYPNCELIIIDGGSKDCTKEIIKKYEKDISYWVSARDNGQSEALNKGIRVARGDFIGWQNSDDLYLPEAFWEFADAIRKFPGYAIYYGDRYHVNERDDILFPKYLSKPSLYYWKYRGMTIANQSAFFAKILVEKFGGMDESLRYAMDREFFLRVLLTGAKAKHIRRFWGAIRHHGMSKTESTARKDWEEERKYICRKLGIGQGKKYMVHNRFAALVRFVLLLGAPKALKYQIWSTLTRTLSRAKGM